MIISKKHIYIKTNYRIDRILLPSKFCLNKSNALELIPPKTTRKLVNSSEYLIFCLPTFLDFLSAASHITSHNPINTGCSLNAPFNAISAKVIQGFAVLFSVSSLSKFQIVRRSTFFKYFFNALSSQKCLGVNLRLLGEGIFLLILLERFLSRRSELQSLQILLPSAIPVQVLPRTQFPNIKNNVSLLFILKIYVHYY